MSNVISSKGYIGIAKQGAKGSTNNTPDIYIKFLEESFQPENENNFQRENGDDELIVTGVKNLHRERFSFTCKARPKVSCYLYAWLLGADAKTGTGDPYTHVLTRDERDWLTIRRKLDTGKILVLTDAKIESITAAAEAGKEVILTVEGNALSPDWDTTEDTPSYETSKPFVFYHSDGAFTLESGSITNIKSFSIKHIVTSQDGMQTDALELADLPDLKFDTEIELGFYAEDTALLKKSAYNNTDTADEGIYSGEFTVDCTYTESGKARELKIVLAKFFWNPVTGFNLNADPAVIEPSLAGIMAKPDAGEPTTVTCKNDESSDLT